MRTLTLKQLRVVEAIARTGKVATAADIVGVTPPAVTLQLQLLEDRVGLALFDRARTGMMLTDAGRILLDTAHRVEAELRATAESLDGLRGLQQGRVSVGVVSTAKYFAPAILGDFRRLHPDIAITLFVGNREEVIASLAAFDSDLVIMGTPPTGLDTIAEIIGDHPHVVIAGPRHPLVRRTRIPLSALSNEKFLVREAGSGTRLLMERIFGEAGIAPHVVMEMKSNETMKQAVMADLGIAFISAHTIASEAENERLAILDIEGLPARRRWQVVRHAGKRMMPAAAALWDFIESDGYKFLPPILKHKSRR